MSLSPLTCTSTKLAPRYWETGDLGQVLRNAKDMACFSLTCFFCKETHRCVCCICGKEHWKVRPGNSQDLEQGARLV